MKTIVRIAIAEGNGTIGDGVYHYVHDVLGRRYGNSVTFAFDFEAEDVMAKLREAGFTPSLDGFCWNVTEPSDYEVGKTVYVEGMLGSIPLIVLQLGTDAKEYKIAKVKYLKFPRKKSFWIYTKSQADYNKEIIESVGHGALGFDKIKEPVTV